MELLGAEVRPVASGSRTLKDAVNEALRDWVASVDNTHYCLGSVMGPHPFPYMVREFQRVVGDEARAQCRELLGGADPDVVVACVGGGSNAAGTFAGFVDTTGPAGRGGGGRRGGGVGGHPRRPARDALASSSRTRAARSSRRTRSRPASTTRASAPSTPTWRRSAGPPTSGPTTTRCSTRSSCWPRPRGSSPPSSRPTPWPGWSARPAGRLPEGSTVLVTLSGRGDKDVAQVRDLLAGGSAGRERRASEAALRSPAGRGPQAAGPLRHGRDGRRLGRGRSRRSWPPAPTPSRWASPSRTR